MASVHRWFQFDLMTVSLCSILLSIDSRSVSSVSFSLILWLRSCLNASFYWIKFLTSFIFLSIVFWRGKYLFLNSDFLYSNYVYLNLTSLWWSQVESCSLLYWRIYNCCSTSLCSYYLIWPIRFMVAWFYKSPMDLAISVSGIMHADSFHGFG